MARLDNRFANFLAALALAYPTVGCSVAGDVGLAASNTAGYAPENPSLVLEFPVEDQERFTAPDGTEVYRAVGIIRNSGLADQVIPPILLIMRDKHGKIIFSQALELADSIAPAGRIVRIDQLIFGFPESAKFAEIGWMTK